MGSATQKEVLAPAQANTSRKRDAAEAAAQPAAARRAARGHATAAHGRSDRQLAATAAQQDGRAEQLEQVANTNTTPNKPVPDLSPRARARARARTQGAGHPSSGGGTTGRHYVAVPRGGANEGAVPRGGAKGRRQGAVPPARARLLELRRDEKPPVDKRVVHEGLEHGHDAVPVVAEHAHRRLARRAEVALGAPLTSMALTSMRVSRKGTRSGNLSRWSATSKHTVAEVDVQYLARVPVQHQVGRVAVAQAEDVGM